VKSIGHVVFNTGEAPGFIGRKILGFSDPQRRVFPFLATDLCDRFTEAAERLAPDLIIGADLISGLICSRSDLRVPVVYYHHDYFWKIKRLREGDVGKSWRRAWGWWIRRRAEEQLIRSVDSCLTGSVTEFEELKLTGAKDVVLIPPTTDIEPVAIPGVATQPCRVVHLGGFGTTATVLGLRRFLETAWPAVRERVPEAELWVVGETSAADEETMTRLEEAGAVVAGFVPNLAGVLRPGDLHVIPWEFGTGIRTRVVSCFLHGQALVAVRAGVAGYEGLENGTHCVLVEDVSELSGPLIDLALDPGRRLRISRAGQDYLRKRLTPEAALPQFNLLVTKLMADHSIMATGR